MFEMCTYRIEVQGQVKEKNFNTISPYQIIDVCACPNGTQFAIHADQAGLIGLLRYLHQGGFVLLSVYRSYCGFINRRVRP